MRVLFTEGLFGVNENEATGGREVQIKLGIVVVPWHPLPSVVESPISKHPAELKV